MTETVRPLLLAELIRTELEWRCRLGEQVAADEYVPRFPTCAGAIEGWIEEAQTAASQLSEDGAADTGGPGVPRTLTWVPGRPVAAAGPLQQLGEYELLERLGAGGMGEVYKARHSRLGKLVALKRLTTGARHSEESVARFLREMKAVGDLDHPNLVEAHYAGEHEGEVYLVMKLIEGVDLARLVREQGPRPVPEACELVRQAAVGLQYLHERGLVHRDIKPSNLMRVPDGTVKVLDLGLARWRAQAAPADHLTGVGAVMGTPDYLAPEQVRNAADVDIRADLYALGGTLFFLLTGRPPFAHRQGMFTKLAAQEAEAPPDVRSLRPDVPAALAELVNGLLAKKPEDRPQTPAEVASALGVLAGDPSTAGASVPAALPLGRRRRRAAILVGACAAAALLGLAALVLWFRRDGGRGPEAPGNGGGVAAKVRVLSLDVQHFTNVDDKNDRPEGLMGEKSFSTRLKDSVTVQARLSRPAYAYLIAFRPDGKEELCFPEKEDGAPPLTDRPRYPSKLRGVNYGLDEGTGLQVFALVVSSRPLPAYKVWRGRRAAFPWKNSRTPAGIVWYDDGDFVEARTADGNDRGPRGKGREVAGKSQVVAVTDWLRQAGPEVEAVAAVGFAVLPRGEP